MEKSVFENLAQVSTALKSIYHLLVIVLNPARQLHFKRENQGQKI